MSRLLPVLCILAFLTYSCSSSDKKKSDASKKSEKSSASSDVASDDFETDEVLKEIDSEFEDAGGNVVSTDTTTVTFP